MSRYFTKGGYLYCKHGVILFGDNCTRCEREEPFWYGAFYAVPFEVITDPADRRGMDAKPVRGRAAA